MKIVYGKLRHNGYVKHANQDLENMLIIQLVPKLNQFIAIINNDIKMEKILQLRTSKYNRNDLYQCNIVADKKKKVLKIKNISQSILLKRKGTLHL